MLVERAQRRVSWGSRIGYQPATGARSSGFQQ